MSEKFASSIRMKLRVCYLNHRLSKKKSLRGRGCGDALGAGGLAEGPVPDPPRSLADMQPRPQSRSQRTKCSQSPDELIGDGHFKCWEGGESMTNFGNLT
jgi:hypothetical protein